MKTEHTETVGLADIEVGDVINVNSKKWLAIKKEVHGSEIEITYKLLN
jgi:hypothetical protein